MIIYTKSEGYHYKHELSGKTYELHEAMCWGGKCTTDRVIIWDSENDCFVDWVMGAGVMADHMEELDNTIFNYVRAYEANKTRAAAEKNPIMYPLTKSGIKTWSGDVVDDILDRDICGDYFISHCNRAIRLPDLAEVHEAFDAFLADVEEIVNEEV